MSGIEFSLQILRLDNIQNFTFIQKCTHTDETLMFQKPFLFSEKKNIAKTCM